jgi:long-subunit fatty acid transport protein
MTRNLPTLRRSLMAAAAAAALIAPAMAQAKGADWLLGMKPVFSDTSPALGVGRFGVGLGPNSRALAGGQEVGGFPYPDAGPVGFSLTPAMAYRARPSLSLEAGLDLTYRTLREPGLIPPDAASPEMGGVGLNLGLRYDYDPRTQLGVSYRSELRGDPLAGRYVVARTSLMEPAYRVAAPQALSANIQRQFGERWSLLGSLGWQQAESLAPRSDAWTAGLGAKYRLHEDLGVGMALEYSTGNGLDPARRNFVRDLPATDGGSYFFGLDLNWRF